MGWRACQMLAVLILRALRCGARQASLRSRPQAAMRRLVRSSGSANQRLIVPVRRADPGQRLSPMGHQPAVLPGEEHEVAFIRGEVDIHVEICGERADGAKELSRRV